MQSFFHSHTTDPAVEPVAGEFPRIEGAEIAAVTFGPRIAGDFYDSLRVSPERILFGMLDVAGRRENNQTILSAAQEIFHKVAAELFAPLDINESEAMTELCLRLNRGIMQVEGGVRSCPAFLACYHERFGTLCYTNAGHTPGLLRDHTGILELNATGLPLGLFSHATCDAPTIGIEKEAALLLVSRGVVEGKCKHDTKEDLEFGLDRVKDHLRDAPSVNPKELCTSILKAVSDFACGPLVHDDMTALAFVRTA